VLERRELGSFDWGLFLAVAGLCALGVLMLHSATFQNPALAGLARRQAVWVGLGAVMLLLALAIDYHTLAEFTPVAYGLSVLVLLYLLLFGRVIAGMRAWLEVGSFNLQPAEFVKIVVVVAIAAYAATTRGRKLGGGSLGILVAIAVPPILLIVKQPDLGTAASIVPALLATVFVAGIRLRVLVILALVVVLALPVAWIVYFKDYQKNRILTFVDPERDPRGAGYQVRQSKIAVGSGGLFGKGLFNGTQSQMQFLPAQHTDFIFAVAAEELGFGGAGLIVALYFFIVHRCLSTARLARDKLGMYIALGIGTVFGCQALVNLCMVVGLVPTVGIPLPLLSYGGSSVVATLGALGLVMNVRMRRFVN
jgi:rod shape determining protein RodA